MKLLLVCLLFACSQLLMSQTATAPIVGDGSPGSPYEIASLENLYWITTAPENLTKSYIQTMDIDASETSSWGADGWAPIGSGSSFTGSYDGQTYTISHLYIYRPGEDNIGLFASTNTATVSNVVMTDIHITGNNYVGGLVGNNSGTTITNSSTAGVVHGNAQIVGGLAGYSNGTVTGCSSACDVSADGFSFGPPMPGIDPDGNTGGLIGYNDGTITQCHTTGTVGCSGSNSGGLVGGNQGTITGCYSISTITATASTAGGLAGVNWGSISNSYANCIVVGTSAVGGFIGYNSAPITQCYSAGSVSATGYRAGGFAGSNEWTIDDSYSRATVTSTGSGQYFGGFVGYFQSNSRSITHCYSTGTVGGSGSDLGGFSALLDQSFTVNCFWDETTSGIATSQGGTNLVTALMKTNTTFSDAGWDIAVWNRDDGTNDGYPYLKWENPSGTAMPVELASFTASVGKHAVTLQWSTATEINNHGFEVERKSGSVWSTIGFIEGHGTTNAKQSYSFNDASASGRVAYRLKQIDRDGKHQYSSEVEVTADAAPATFEMSQNYPNPFNPATVIRYQIPSRSRVTLKVYDVLGHEVATLVEDTQEPGTYAAQFNGTGVSSGLYFYTITAGSFTATKKFVLMK